MFFFSLKLQLVCFAFVIRTFIVRPFKWNEAKGSFSKFVTPPPLTTPFRKVIIVALGVDNELAGCVLASGELFTVVLGC